MKGPILGVLAGVFFIVIGIIYLVSGGCPQTSMTGTALGMILAGGVFIGASIVWARSNRYDN